MVRVRPRTIHRTHPDVVFWRRRKSRERVPRYDRVRLEASQRESDRGKRSGLVWPLRFQIRELFRVRASPATESLEERSRSHDRVEGVDRDVPRALQPKGAISSKAIGLLETNTSNTDFDRTVLPPSYLLDEKRFVNARQDEKWLVSN